jgi:hypothetical protein
MKHTGKPLSSTTLRHALIVPRLNIMKKVTTKEEDGMPKEHWSTLATLTNSHRKPARSRAKWRQVDYVHAL